MLTFHNAFFAWPKWDLFFAFIALKITVASIFSHLFLQYCFSCKESSHLSITNYWSLFPFLAKFIHHILLWFFFFFFNAFQEPIIQNNLSLLEFLFFFICYHYTLTITICNINCPLDNFFIFSWIFMFNWEIFSCRLWLDLLIEAFLLRISLLINLFNIFMLQLIFLLFKSSPEIRVDFGHNICLVRNLTLRDHPQDKHLRSN